MNRIYQGRVASVQIPNPDEVARKAVPWVPFDSDPKRARELGEAALWEHHALFQDAVNYYLVGLLALAAPSNKALGQLRQRIAVPGDDYFIWGTFSRRGSKRRGLRDSVAPYLTSGNGEPLVEECFEAVLRGNEADAMTRDAAVSNLLEVCDGAGAIQQEGRAYWPKFCDPETKANFAGDPIMQRRETHRRLLPRVLHHPDTRFDSDSLNQFDVYSIATPNAKRPHLEATKAMERLHQAIVALGNRRPEASADFTRLATALAAAPADLSIPGYVESSAKGDVKLRLFALMLFRHLERSPFTFDLLRSLVPPLKDDDGPLESHIEEPRVTADPVRLARGERGYVFRAFTSLQCWNPANDAKPQWKEFDIAAFKYALTAVNQIEEKAKEREAEAASLRIRLDYMRGKSAKLTPTSENEEPPPVIAGDPRVVRLRAVLASPELRVANAMTDGESTDYGLHPRTIRGFRDLRKLWRAHVQAGEAFSEPKQQSLRDELRRFQTEHTETIGSVALFDAFLRPENWLIWQEPNAATAAVWADAGFVSASGDPLTALLEERELEERIASLSQPIQLTPADPVFSRRQYDFHAVSKFSAGKRARCRHEPEACAFVTEIARRHDGIWRIERIRVQYTAPRFLRDGLRSDDGPTDLGTTRWLQPMMAALSPSPELPQNLTDCPVCLMPEVARSGQRRMLLNFPVTLEPAALVAQLGKAAKWMNQFCTLDKQPFALRWPDDGWAAGKEPSAWYHTGESFTLLGIDLGTRDAGAIAHLTVTSGEPTKTVHRVLGEAGGRRWYAQVTGTELIRLPGEDARLFVHGERRVEPYGERGRLASDTETAEAAELCQQLGEAPDLLGSGRDRLAFPKQNDRLLIALRRAQGRLARLQSWSWRLRDEKHRDEAWQEIVEARADRPQSIAEACTAINGEMVALRRLLTSSIETLANRIVPLRGRRWKWQVTDDKLRWHRLAQVESVSTVAVPKIAGQRGISHERIEQLEELRRRCQSLNRALHHLPAEKVRIGRRTKGEDVPDPCPDLLDKIEHLREQRVDQTAHAILAAALGVQLTAPRTNDAKRRRSDIHGEYKQFRLPVDFVVIEDLSRYLSSQDRARRENTRLMQWCHRQLVAKLRQLCETYGIPVLATPAMYSSRFCSRTGAAGFRAVELTPDMRDRAPWRFHLQRLAADASGVKPMDAETRSEAKHVEAVFAALDRLNRGRKEAKKPYRTLLAPMAGGPIFVPMAEAPVMHADLNAAINIGLRGVAAPAQHDIHHRVRTERSGAALKVRTTSKRERARWGKDAPAIEGSIDTVGADRLPNVFVDVAHVADFDCIKVSGIAASFATSRGLWTSLKRKAWDRIRQLNDARIRPWETDAQDDVRY